MAMPSWDASGLGGHQLGDEHGDAEASRTAEQHGDAVR
jgi:hypothetical protein